uniref:ARAD1D49126p n=1 Tax=Blastobotrys adeninivorans TaxID=409370 RepID=A0A060TJS3_BLAAD
MVDADKVQIAQIRAELLAAVDKLSNRCLYQASKWAAEALNGMEGDSTSDVVPDYLLPDQTTAKDLFARSCFACHEYDRSADILKNSDSPLSVFLRLYSKYISGEKKKDEDRGGVMTAKDVRTPNCYTDEILRDLESSAHFKSDPFLLYLYGVLMRQQGNDEAAITALLESVNLFPYNWSAWQDLLACIPSIDSLNSIIKRLPDNIMSSLFLINAYQELYQVDDRTFGLLRTLQVVFPRFMFLNTQKALLHYHSLNYNESETEFDNVLRQDPHRLDDLDAYSNILYVMERRSKLAFLAQLASTTDKFRPETCCIIANYYSLKSEHEKAIQYYQRALLLNSNTLSAWTLMGHEYIELKNTHAAIESYRRAVDANKRDFRAWYGLGQAYEVLDMHYYSLYYYQRAAALRPHDVRMWQAMGHSYEKLDRLDDSIKAYKRALRVSNMDPLILLKIAMLYTQQQDMETAASFMKMCVAEESVEGSQTEETARARLWLAKYEMDKGNWSRAHAYAESITRGSANEIEEARIIVRETKNRQLH